MKSPSRFKMSAFATLAALGALGIAGACGDSSGPPPPPPPPPLAAPTNLTATVVSETQIDLAWTDNSTTESGFKIQSCSGAACSNFSDAGTVAANVTAFSHTGLTANTSYSYRVLAQGAEGVSDPSNTSTAITSDVQPPVGAAPILVGAGEITSCASSVGPSSTAALIEGMLGDTNVTVFTAGHNLDDMTPGSTFETCFNPTWGRFKARTFYAIGNNDYEGGRGQAGVFGYFGERAGPAGKGWYSFDRGAWHIIVLNTATWDLGTAQMTDPASEQIQWLTADLQANTKQCIMAISWERRFYSSTGTWHRHGNLDLIWDLLYAAGADVFVSAKDHYYERYALSDPDGNVDEARGIRQFIVGTGGRTLHNLANPAPNVEVRDRSTWGVLKFTLNADSYTWEFVPTTPGGFTDTGTTNCH